MHQRQSARERGIGWLMSYDQWVWWWEKKLGPDWFELRGNRRDQYCMARRGDKGPYALWNIDCITNAQNHKDAFKNGKYPKGEDCVNSKLTNTQVIAIYLSEPDEERMLAKKYNTSLRYINSIKNKRIWTHLVQGLPSAKFKGSLKGEEHVNAKLTAEIVRQIYLAKGGLHEIGRRFGVDASNVRRIKTGMAWGSVTAGLPPAPHIKGRGRRTDRGFGLSAVQK